MLIESYTRERSSGSASPTALMQWEGGLIDSSIGGRKGKGKAK